MNPDVDKVVKPLAVTKGLVLGLILTIVGILAFYILTNSSSMVVIIGAPLIFSVLVPIAVAAFFCSDLRKKVGGYWTFKQAVTGIFVMLLVSYLTSFVLRDLLFAKVIEPNMIEKTEAAMTNVVGATLEKSNTNQEEIDKQLDKVHQQFEEQKNPSIGKQVTGVAISIIFVFVFALIFAAIFKREPPRYAYDVNEPPVDPTIV